MLHEVSSMNLILGISKEFKWKAKVMLLEVSSLNFIFEIFKAIKWTINHGVTRSIMEELHSLDIQGDKMECQSRVIRSIIDEFLLRISKEIEWKLKVVLLEVSLMNFNLRISKKIKWKVKVVSLEVSLMNFFLGISKEIK